MNRRNSDGGFDDGKDGGFDAEAYSLSDILREAHDDEDGDGGPQGAPADLPDGGAAVVGAGPEGTSSFFEWMQSIVGALLFSVLLFVFIGRLIGVDGTSMAPTLHHNDRVVMSGLFYTPKQGDVVVLQVKSFDTEPLVKRILATGGQTVDIDFSGGEVRVDGQLMDEPYIAGRTTTRLDFEGPLTVPEGYVFVMGDNRNMSTDSRDSRIGLVDERCILGRVYAVAFPLGRIGAVK